MANKAYKYRIYPTDAQAILIRKTCGCCRLVYNKGLEMREEAHKSGTKVGYNETSTMLTKLKQKEEFAFLKEVDSIALVQSLRDLDIAYTNFFKRKARHPRFKAKRHSRQSFRTQNYNNNIRLMGGGIRLPKLGVVKASISRVAPENWTLKSATVSAEHDGDFYCSLLYEYEMSVQPAVIHEDKALGLDFKVSCLYADSEGGFGGMPKYFKASGELLAKRQRQLKHKDKKSKNYEKARRRVAKIHLHIANQRKDFLHKKSTEIANLWDLVCVEDISIKELVKNRRYKSYRKSVLDNGWSEFTAMLSYKLTDRGKQLIKVEKKYLSSQMCSCCGVINPELADDSIRKWVCPVCGTHHDR